MYNSSFYKHSARGKLRSCYAVSAICALIFMIPMYLSSRLLSVVNTSYTGIMLASEMFQVLVQIFVINIFEIGFIRFLLNLKPAEGNEQKSYDYNLILSGYTINFSESLRSTFMAMLKLFLLALLAAIPTIAVFLYIILHVPSDVIARISSAVYETSISYSPQALNELSQLIDRSFPHLGLFSGLYMIATIGALIPFIYKSYEYKMIPFILADDTEVSYKKVMKRTRDIMEGFRWRFFMIELSFIGYIILCSVLFLTTGSLLIYCAALALLMPYQYMTYIEFYRQRNEVIEHNISVYGESEA